MNSVESLAILYARQGVQRPLRLPDRQELNPDTTSACMPANDFLHLDNCHRVDQRQRSGYCHFKKLSAPTQVYSLANQAASTEVLSK